MQTHNKNTSDVDSIFNLLENMLNKQEEHVLNYMNESMTQDERNRHGDNIWGYLIRAKGVIAEIKMNLLVDNINKNEE